MTWTVLSGQVLASSLEMKLVERISLPQQRLHARAQAIVPPMFWRENVRKK